jgi:hypothetical protein
VLYGLAVGGAIGGVEGAVAPNTMRDVFNRRQQVAQARADLETAQAQAAQQNIQLESVRAADTHIEAMKRVQQIDAATDVARAQYRALNDSHEKFLTEEYGILPDLSIVGNGKEVDDGAVGGQHTLAAENGGIIPPVHILVQPHDPQNSQFKIGVYAPSQQDLVKNQQGYRQVVDDARAVQGLAPIDDLSWNTNGFKGQRELAQGAMQFLAPAQQFSKENIGAVLAQRQQMLANYKNHTNANGQPDAKPEIIQQLQNSVDYLSKAKEDIQNEAIDAKKKEAAALQPFEIEKARAMGQAKAEVDAQIARGSNAALANVPPHLIPPATQAATKAGEDFAQAKSVSDRLAAMMQAAKNGNVVSYQLIPQEGALQITTSQGVHRINMAEIENYGGGSIFQRMEGRFGKALTGKSIPDSVLGDMEEMQRIQAEGSRVKYENTLKTINQTYGSNFQPVQLTTMTARAPATRTYQGHTYTQQSDGSWRLTQ